MIRELTFGKFFFMYGLICSTSFFNQLYTINKYFLIYPNILHNKEKKGSIQRYRTKNQRQSAKRLVCFLHKLNQYDRIKDSPFLMAQSIFVVTNISRTIKGGRFSWKRNYIYLKLTKKLPEYVGDSLNILEQTALSFEQFGPSPSFVSELDFSHILLWHQQYRKIQMDTTDKQF